MLTLSPALKTALDAKPTQVEWANTLKTMLGANPRFRCWRASDANAVDPVATGTEFLNCAISGFTIKGYKITGIGSASNVTVKTAADLATGKAVARIEGNGHYVELSLGLPASGKDLIFTANPTATTGVALNVSISPPSVLGSGTGYLPPALDADAPAYIIFQDWANDTNNGEFGRVHFNNRIKNWVFEDEEYAANVGDVRVTQSTEMVVMGQFEVGATLFSNNPAVNSVPGKAVHKTLIAFKPTEANWPNYPRQTGAVGGGYRRGTRTINGLVREYGLSKTFMPPFKAVICKADGTVLHTHEMPKDGLPINSEQLSNYPTKTKSIRMHMHCANVLEWESSPPVLSSYAKKYYSGADPGSLRKSIGKERAYFNQAYPIHEIGQPHHSSGLWYAMPKWAMPCNLDFIVANDDPQRAQDAYLYPRYVSDAGWTTPQWARELKNVPVNDIGQMGSGMELYQGWGYEPGGWGCHDQYTGPGGVRIDRSGLPPSPLCIHLTDPTWVHLRDNTPIGEMVKHWNQAYFNHPHHNIVDVRTLETIPVSEVNAGLWAYGEGYYGGNLFYTDVDHTIPQFAPARDSSASGGTVQPHFGSFVDEDMRLPWNGAVIDTLHNYSMPGWAALFYNSVTHAYSQKHRYLAHIMAHLGSGATTPDKNALDYFNMRNHAWRMLQQGMMWKLASDHPLGISRADVEARIIGELNAVNRDVYTPLFVTNVQTPEFKLLRNLGISASFINGNYWHTNSFGMSFYMADVMMFWKQIGLFRRMWDYSDATRNALLAIIKTMDTGSIAFFNETQGAYLGKGGGLFGGAPSMMIGDGTIYNAQVPTSWTDWQNNVHPREGVSDWIHNPAGQFKAPDSSDNLRAKWPTIRKHFFSDIPCAYDVNACVTLVDGWHTEVANILATAEAQNGPTNLRLIDWAAHPAYARVLAPTVLGD